MGSRSIRVSAVIPASPAAVYGAWIDGKKHTAMTGGAATAQNQEGKRFTAWDGYISGRTEQLDDGALIVQSWRTSEFPAKSEDSRLEIRFEGLGRTTRVTIDHCNIPDGQAESYRSGWSEHYLVPMKRYFGERAAPKKSAAKKNKKSGAKRAATKKPSPRKKVTR